MQAVIPKTKAELLEAFGSRKKVRVFITETSCVVPTSVVGIIRSLRHEDTSGQGFGGMVVNEDTREVWDGCLGVFK